MRACSKCGKTDHEVRFYKNRNAPDGLSSHCASCSNNISLDWQRKNPRRARLNQIKHLYGLTEEEYDALPDACEICGKKEKLGVDHDHNFGFVRGVLCDKCNRGLGYFRHDSELLLRASSYLLGVLDSTTTDLESTEEL